MGPVTVTVRLSGPLAESLGSRRAIQMVEGATVDELLGIIAREARIEGSAGTLAVVAGGRFLGHSHALTDGDEVAVLVPVAGG
jgi:molybdopterin converting factor small subunit